MSKLFKSIVAGILALSMCTFGTPVRAAIDVGVDIDVSVVIAASTSMTVEFLDTETGATGTGSLAFDLSGLDLDEPATLWAVADECLLVSYSSNYSWGVRIITDNRQPLIDQGIFDDDLDGDGDVDLDDFVIAGAAIGDYVAPAMADFDDDGNYTDELYSGLLNVTDLDEGIVGEDPSKRATWAWQGYDEWADGDVVTYAPIADIVSHFNGTKIEDTNVGLCWDPDYDDWHYIGDKNDDGFSEEILDGVDLTYPIVTFGSPGDNGYLVPATGGNIDGALVDLADGDVVIFIASRFASTNWEDPNNPFPYLLGPDTYTTSLYVELIHE